MATRLKELDVRWVSLVDRAAVRNAENPDEPQRWLVWKAEGEPETAAKAETDWDDLRERIDALEKAARPNNDETIGGGMAVTKADTSVAVSDALAALRTADGDPQLADVIDRLNALAKPDEHAVGQEERAPVADRMGPADEGNDDPVAKAMTDLRELAKGASARDRQQIYKTSTDLQREYLAKASPAGLAAWENRYSSAAEPAGEHAELVAKAEAVRKVEGVSRFEAMRRATRQSPELVGRSMGLR
jgi:hypothetical protein